jgi:hypothetical protein
MQVAREVAQPVCDVELYAAQYPEDHAIIPEYFIRTPDMERSMMDLGVFEKPRKLPLIKDILDRLYAASDSEYFIYTNVDIALMPNFYSIVSNMVASGLDAFVINRRTIPSKYSSVDLLPLMYAEAGQPHCGYDCFVFKREHYPRFDLGNTCIGAMAVGSMLLINLVCFSTKFVEFRDLHLTFHLGNSETWRDPELDDIQEFNEMEFVRVAQRLTPKFDVDRLPEVGQSTLNDLFKRIKEVRAQGLKFR